MLGERKDKERIMALKDELIDELRDMYSAENQLIVALPKLKLRD